jgi:hypothetical protein
MRPRAVESAGGRRALCEPRYQHLAKMPGTAANDGLGIPRFLDKLGRAAVRWGMALDERPGPERPPGSGT